MNKPEVQTAEKLSKKAVRQAVYEKLAVALSDYKKELKDKRFEKNLKRASKLFAADIAKEGARTRKVKKTKTVKTAEPAK